VRFDHRDEGIRRADSRLRQRFARAHRQRESGQAMVEFALILFPLLLLVVGIIQFGIGLNYWLDMQRIANQGARWAAVNNWPPDCPRGSAVGDCDGNPHPTLQQSLHNNIITSGLKAATTVEICFPDAGSKAIGSPVKVHLEAPFTLVPIVGVGTITLGANATMRLEQSQDPARGGLITGEVGSC
jgi:hypothetical protein